MPHSVELITTIAAALGLALIFGFIAARLRLPALVGYLLAGIVLGLSLSVASTVVLLKALESLGVLATPNGRIAVGWLIVEDLVMVLVLLPPLAQVFGNTPGTTSGHSLVATLAITLGEVALFIGLMLVVGRRFFPWLLWQVARTGSRELFTLCVVAAALGIAYGSSVLFGVSFALGAFFAGMVLRESANSPSFWPAS